MKKDYFITFCVLLVTGLLIYIATRNFFLNFSSTYKVLGGFIKFFFLASIGDLIGVRIKLNTWKIPPFMMIRSVVWGVIGIFIVFMFTIFSTGIQALQSSSVLPFEGSLFFTALFTSILMNLIFAPTMMVFHRITDTYLDLRCENKKVTIGDTIDKINWRQFIKFTVFQTIPFFWIPAHTITFLIPEAYRVIFAAVLGIVLGILLGLFQSKKTT